MKKRVADIIFETLVDLNIVDCFTVVGGGAMHLDNALALNTDMNSHFNQYPDRSDGRMGRWCTDDRDFGKCTI